MHGVTAGTSQQAQGAVLSNGGATITVEVPGVPAPAAPPGLAFTGTGALGLLVLAAVLLALGAVALRRSRQRHHVQGSSVMRRTTRARASTVATVLAALLLSTTGLVLADEMREGLSVGTEVRDYGGRNFEVTDVSGRPFDEEYVFSLQPGVPRTFRTAVTDEVLEIVDLANQGFTVYAEMNNLYRHDEGAVDYNAERIPSSAIDVSYATDPLRLAGLLADIKPEILLETVDGGISCSIIDDIDGIDLSGTASSLPLVGSLLDACNDLLEGTLTFDDVPLAEVLVEALDLSDVTLATLPLVPDTGDDGPFTNADYSHGIGGNDEATDVPEGHTPTAIDLLVGEPATSIAALDPLLAALFDGLDLVSEDGDGAVASVQDVINALLSSGDAEIEALGEILNDLGLADQVTVINELLDYVVQPLGLDDLDALSGQYWSLPRLTVDPDGVPAGTYKGTLTVTFIDD